MSQSDIFQPDAFATPSPLRLCMERLRDLGNGGRAQVLRLPYIMARLLGPCALSLTKYSLGLYSALLLKRSVGKLPAPLPVLTKRLTRET